MQSFDVVIIGGGPAGLFAANELMLNNPSLKVCIVEKGGAGKNRVCPPANRLCETCDICDVVNGIGGSGLQVDAKLNGFGMSYFYFIS